MVNRFDDLWKSAASDGATTPVGVTGDHTVADVDELMEAWFHERQTNIEYSLYLDQASHLLRRLLLEGELTEKSRRKMRNLIQALEVARRDNPVE